MADKLTKEERRLIDDAIAQGRVQVIPAGQMTQTYEAISWKAQLQMTWKMSLARRRANRPPDPRSPAHPPPLVANGSDESAALDARIMTLAEEGHSYRKIGEIVGLSKNGVAKRMAKMKRRAV
jgi:hypothetical protein